MQLLESQKFMCRWKRLKKFQMIPEGAEFRKNERSIFFRLKYNISRRYELSYVYFEVSCQPTWKFLIIQSCAADSTKILHSK